VKKRESKLALIERKFWIATAIGGVLLVVAVLVDAFFRGWLSH